MQNEYHVLFLFFVGFVFKWGVDYDLLFLLSFTSWIKTHSVWTQHGFCCFCFILFIGEISLLSTHITLFQSVLPARLSWFPRALPVWRNPTSEIQGTLLKNKPHDQGCDSWAVGDSAETSVDPESKVRARINGESCQLPGGLWIRACWSFFSPVGLKPKGQRCDKHRWVAAAQIAGGLTGLATSALFRQ